MFGNIKFTERFEKRNLEVDLIWNNINKIGRHHEKVGVNSQVKNIEIEKFNIISQELEILNPDFLVFFTGPYRDREIIQKFPNL